MTSDIKIVYIETKRDKERINLLGVQDDVPDTAPSPAAPSLLLLPLRAQGAAERAGVGPREPSTPQVRFATGP